MIASMNTIAKLPRWLSGGVLALAMGLLPFGIAYGQDYDAVERRLGAAVADGEITLSQAQTMMRALRATSEDQELEKLKAGIKERLRHHGEELRKQLAAGEITKEEMEAKFKAKEREMWGHYREAEMKRHRRKREHGEDRELEKLKAGIEERLRHHGEELRKELAAGEITKEEMEAKFKAKEREMWGHYREAKMKRHRRKREHGEDRELEKLKAGIEERLRHHGEELRKELAAGEITKEEMEAKFKAKEREMWGHYREAEMKHHRGDGEHGEGDGNAPRDAYMHRIREIEEAMRSGKISREEGTRAIEETKRSLEEATRDGQETSSTSPRKDDARTGMKTIGVEPRFVPEEEYNRVEADLKRQVAAGNLREEEASRELVKLQNANNMAHIEKSVREGKTTRAKADAIYKKLGIK